VVENVGVATGISLITQSNPEIRRTSGLLVAISASGCPLTSGGVGGTASESDMVKLFGVIARISFYYTSQLILRQCVAHR
jgi:hypothetical protein